jgi:2-polyprenyl-3-methyl-5-hydroxy-6-metoxy-1,4-benzoquinol methylase
MYNSQRRHEEYYCSLIREGKISANFDINKSNDYRAFLSFFKSKYFPKKGIVLDVGCGTGAISMFLAQKGYVVDALDFSRSAIKIARNISHRSSLLINFYCGNILDTDLPTSRYDVIIDNNCFHCIIGKTNRYLYLKKIYNALKPRGLFFCTCMCNLPKDKKLLAKMNLKTRTLSNLRYFATIKEILDEFKQNKFIIIYRSINKGKHGDNDSIVLYAKREYYSQER